MVHPEEHGEQSPEQSNDSPPHISGNVDGLSNKDLPSVSSDRLMKQDLEGSTAGKPETSEQECERGSDGSDSSPNPTSPKRARMLDKSDSETVTSGTKENILSQPEVPDIAAQHEDSRTTPQKQDLERSTMGKHETSEQECERGSDGSDSSPNPTSPKRTRMAEKFDDKKVVSDTEKQELEESTTGKHETSEQECERGSDGSDSSPNPTSPKRARMSEKSDVKKVDSDTKANILSQPEVPDTASQHKDSQTTHQEQVSAESTKVSEIGIAPGCSKSEPCAHDDLNPHGPANQVENAQENPCPVLEPNIPINNQDRLENVPLVGLEIPFFEPEAIELQVPEKHADNVTLVELETPEIPFFAPEAIEPQVHEEQLENVPFVGHEALDIPFVEPEAIELHVQEQLLEHFPHVTLEIPFVEPEPIEPEVEEVFEIIDNDGHQQYFPPSPMTMSDKDDVLAHPAYECPHCEILFKYPDLYLLHMKSHRRNSPICGCSFVCACGIHCHNDKFWFNTHLLEDAHDANAYEGQEPAGADGLPIPIGDVRKAYWRQSEVYWCRYCCILYIHQTMQRDHVMHHNVPHPFEYVCRPCLVNYYERNTFNLHLFEARHDIYLIDENDLYSNNLM